MHNKGCVNGYVDIHIYMHMLIDPTDVIELKRKREANYQ